jgi:hypothetical protein
MLVGRHCSHGRPLQSTPIPVAGRVLRNRSPQACADGAYIESGSRRQRLKYGALDRLLLAELELSWPNPSLRVAALTCDAPSPTF